jgi:hypothetical protein
MALPPAVTLLSLPNADVAVLQGDGSLSLPWRRCLQQLVAASGTGSIAAIIAELAVLELAVTAAQDTANAALAAANASADDAELALLLALSGGRSTSSAVTPDETGFGFFAGGLMTAGEFLGQAVWGHPITFMAPDAENVALSLSSATATSALSLLAFDASNVAVGSGSITFAAGSSDGVVAWAASTTVPEGGYVQLYAPPAADLTLASVRGSIHGVAG